MFGGNLQRCRTAMLSHVRECRRALILGEGDGRFLAEFLRICPEATVDVLDISPTMLALARKRVAGNSRVRFVVANVETEPIPGMGYDLIVTNFFLDCFSTERLARLIPKLAECLIPGGLWIVGDFRVPSRAALRRRAEMQLAIMYAGFRVATGLTTVQLADPTPVLQGNGLSRIVEATWQNGFLASQLWQKPAMDSREPQFCERAGSLLHNANGSVTILPPT